MALILRLDLHETQRLLRLAMKGELYPKTRRDAVIIYCIQNKYSDELMPRLREELLYLATIDSYNLLGKQNAFYCYIENKDFISGGGRSLAIINCVRCIVRNLYYEQEKYLSDKNNK